MSCHRTFMLEDKIEAMEYPGPTSCKSKRGDERVGRSNGETAPWMVSSEVSSATGRSSKNASIGFKGGEGLGSCIDSLSIVD